MGFNGLTPDSKGPAIERKPILVQGIDAVAFEHFSVEDVVSDLVAAVHDEDVVHHETGTDAVFTTGVGVVGRESVIDAELLGGGPIDDDAAAVALGIGGEVHVFALIVQAVVGRGAQINREINNGIQLVGVLQGVAAAHEQEGGYKRGQQAQCLFHVAKIRFLPQ